LAGLLDGAEDGLLLGDPLPRGQPPDGLALARGEADREGAGRGGQGGTRPGGRKKIRGPLRRVRVFEAAPAGWGRGAPRPYACPTAEVASTGAIRPVRPCLPRAAPAPPPFHPLPSPDHGQRRFRP